MPEHAWFAKGSYNFNCDECGRVFKAEHMRGRWDGAQVCDTGSCWEPRHPQDFLRPVTEDIPAIPARPWIPSVGTPLLWFNASAFPITWSNRIGGIFGWTNT